MRGPMRANSSQVENLLVTVNSAEHGPDDEVSPRVSRGSVIVKKGYGHPGVRVVAGQFISGLVCAFSARNTNKWRRPPRAARG